MSVDLRSKGLDDQKHAGKTALPASCFYKYFNVLAAVTLLCCQVLAAASGLGSVGGASAWASEGTCPGVDGGDLAALEDCLLNQVCIEGIYDPPRTVVLAPRAMETYRAVEIDVSGRHFKLEVRFRKRAGTLSGQCDYESPRRFMFSLVESGGPDTLKVSFDPDWVY